MENRKEMRTWLDDFNLNHPLVIAGPCSAETEDQVLKIAHDLKILTSQYTEQEYGSLDSSWNV
jgi:3-deoxy-D-arabino-heptulosonate 7-phosphate (DAHP) synthase